MGTIHRTETRMLQPYYLFLSVKKKLNILCAGKKNGKENDYYKSEENDYFCGGGLVGN